MNFEKLRPFIEKSARSSNIKIKTAAESLLDEMISAKETEEIEQPTLHAQERNQPLNNRPQDAIDQKIDTWMPDLAKPEAEVSEFGKAASAYSCDIGIDKLPKDTQEDIKKFVPISDLKTKVVQYGMVESELAEKVDPHNFKLAEEHVKQEISKKGKRFVADKFQEKVPDKYILVLNDSIIDGHHFLAMAKILGITCSLKVLDLTPIRFQKQKTASTLFHRISYGLHDYSR